MFDFHEFEASINSENALSSLIYKKYAQQIEEYTLEMSIFPSEIFQIYLDLLKSPKFLQMHGIYHFFKGIYFDFSKLSDLQKHQLKNAVEQCLTMPLENNLELWLSEILQKID